MVLRRFISMRGRMDVAKRRAIEELKPVDLLPEISTALNWRLLGRGWKGKEGVIASGGFGKREMVHGSQETGNGE